VENHLINQFPMQQQPAEWVGVEALSNLVFHIYSLAPQIWQGDYQIYQIQSAGSLAQIIFT
jgi:ABC-type uncharacterized transport system permease subunit